MTSTTSNTDSVSVSEGDPKPTSASPEEPGSVFSGPARSNSEVTLVSSVNDETRSISTTAAAPHVPVNTPFNGSVAGDSVGMGQVIERVSTLKVDVNGIALKDQEDGKQTPNGVKENDMWSNEAIEAATIGLKRLGQLAKDENAVDPSKSVEQYFSEHLSKVIKAAELEFDAAALE